MFSESKFKCTICLFGWITIFIGISSQTGWAQKTVVFKINEKGNIVEGFPSFLTEKDLIRFELLPDTTTADELQVANKITSFLTKIPDEGGLRDFLKGELTKKFLFDAAGAASLVDTMKFDALFKALNDYKNRYYHEHFLLEVRQGARKESIKFKKGTADYYVLDTVQINFFISKSRPQNDVIAQHLKLSRHLFRDFQEIVSSALFTDSYNSLRASLAKIERAKMDSLIQKVTTGDVISLQALYEEAVRLGRPYRVLTSYIITSNLKWMSYWLWLSDTELVLNPLNMISADDKQIATLDQKIQVEKKNIEFLEKILNTTPTKISFKELQELRNAVIDATKLIKDNEQQLEKLKMVKSKLKENLAAREAGRVVLYRGKLLVSGSHYNWMRNHDALQDYELQNPNSLPKIFFEDDKVNVMVYNLPTKVHTALEESIQPYTPQSVFSGDILPVLEGIGEAIAVDPFEIVQVLGFEQSGQAADPREQFLHLTAIYRWFQAQTLPAVFSLSVKSGLDTLYKTDISGPSKIKSPPARVKYAITTKDDKGVKKELINDLEYKIYKKYYLQPAAGLVYLPQDRLSSTFDETTQAFKDESLGRFDFIVGVKYFPFGVNIESRSHDRKQYKVERDCDNKKILGSTYRPYLHKLNRLRGNGFLNNFSIFVGVGTTQKPLNNWFFGANFDVIKGLAISGGSNVFSKNQFAIENGKITGSSSVFRMTSYVGFTVDPIVMAKAMNIFQPKIK